MKVSVETLEDISTYISLSALLRHSLPPSSVPRKRIYLIVFVFLAPNLLGGEFLDGVGVS